MQRPARRLGASRAAGRCGWRSAPLLAASLQGTKQTRAGAAALQRERRRTLPRIARCTRLKQGRFRDPSSAAGAGRRGLSDSRHQRQGPLFAPRRFAEAPAYGGDRAAAGRERRPLPASAEAEQRRHRHSNRRRSSPLSGSDDAAAVAGGRSPPLCASAAPPPLRRRQSQLHALHRLPSLARARCVIIFFQIFFSLLSCPIIIIIINSRFPCPAAPPQRSRRALGHLSAIPQTLCCTICTTRLSGSAAGGCGASGPAPPQPRCGPPRTRPR